MPTDPRTITNTPITPRRLICCINIRRI